MPEFDFTGRRVTSEGVVDVKRVTGDDDISERISSYLVGSTGSTSACPTINSDEDSESPLPPDVVVVRAVVTFVVEGGGRCVCDTPTVVSARCLLIGVVLETFVLGFLLVAVRLLLFLNLFCCEKGGILLATSIGLIPSFAASVSNIEDNCCKFALSTVRLMFGSSNRLPWAEVVCEFSTTTA